MNLYQRSWSLRLLLLGMGLILAGSGLLFGPMLISADGTEVGPCHIEELAEQLAEYAEQLDALKDISEDITEDELAELLGELWLLGEAIHQSTIDCGFEPLEDMDHMDDMDDMMDMDHAEGHEMGEMADLETIMEFAMSIGDPEHGQELFTTVTATGFACATCHNVDSRETLIGPGLLGVAHMMHLHAEDGEEAEAVELPFEVEDDILPEGTLAYLYTSIVDPSAVVVEGFPDMLMPQTFSQIFTDEEIADIIAYLITLVPDEDSMEMMNMDAEETEEAGHGH